MDSEEDKALFRRAVAGVKPLKKSAIIPTIKAKPVIPAKRPAPKYEPLVSDKIPQAQVHLSDFYTSEVHSDTTLSYCSQQMPVKRMRELKQGRIRWESRLDLHGYKQDEAQKNLLDFLTRAISHNQRCLLLIHGKGSYGGEAPVLKNLVNHWLRQLPCVLAFYSAQPKDGGTGALYVLLKRDKIKQ